MEYGCIAEHLAHSFSKEIHAKLADYSYELCELSPSEVGAFLTRRDFRGINVTIPYKQTVIPYLDEISPIAKRIGAVNTIINREGKLYGDNTDFWGMKYLLEREQIVLKDRSVLIFGTGGTSRTARAVAEHLGAVRIGIVSRQESPEAMTYAQAAQQFRDARVVINTTPAGMYPQEETVPYDLLLEDFPHLEGVLDAIYHPLRSELVLAARARGIRASGGLTMLVMQAAVAAERFLGVPLPQDRLEEIDREIRTSKENLVLIGMPGCGKSSVGAELAKKYNRRLIDTDQELKVAAGMTPADMIRECGEAAFRDAESEIVRCVAQQNGAVIATGGGVVLREENVRRLRRNGRLIFLDRPPQQLPVTADRPLSSSRELVMQRYGERIAYYRAAADATVLVSGDISQTAEQVSTAFEALMQ